MSESDSLMDRGAAIFNRLRSVTESRSRSESEGPETEGEDAEIEPEKDEAIVGETTDDPVVITSPSATEAMTDEEIGPGDVGDGLEADPTDVADEADALDGNGESPVTEEVAEAAATDGDVMSGDAGSPGEADLDTDGTQDEATVDTDGRTQVEATVDTDGGTQGEATVDPDGGTQGEATADTPPPAAEAGSEPPRTRPEPRPVTLPHELGPNGLPGLDQLPEVPSHDSPEQVVAEGRRDAAGHGLPRIMAVANQKGGVGKTTTAVNLGAALADLGYRVLVVDLDPQGNASTGLGINIRDLQLSMYDVVIHEQAIDDTIEATAMRNLFVAPASLDLAGAEIELVPAFSRELRLRHALAEVHDDYDYILIDCPPSLGLLTVNGLAAAQEVLVPIQCEYYALEGLGQLLRNVSLVQRNLNQSLQVSTFVCVMYDARTKLADQVVNEVRAHFGDKVCRMVVPRTVRLSEAPSYGQPILAFDPMSRGAIAYRELAREISGGSPADAEAS